MKPAAGEGEHFYDLVRLPSTGKGCLCTERGSHPLLTEERHHQPLFLLLLHVLLSSPEPAAPKVAESRGGIDDTP